MLYNWGMFFFILSSFVGYILSFGLVRLRTVRLSALSGSHSEFRCSRSCAEDVTLTNVIIKTPGRKWTGVRMTPCPEVRGWEFWSFSKKTFSDLGESSWVYRICHAFFGSVSWDPTLGEASWDLKLDKASPVGGLRDEPRVCWVRWNGQHSKNCVSLPSCRKTKLKKSINVSYLN